LISLELNTTFDLKSESRRDIPKSQIVSFLVFRIFPRNKNDNPAKSYGSLESLVDEVIHFVVMEWAELIQDGSESIQFELNHLIFTDQQRIDLISPPRVCRFWINQATGNP
jgi:hypothetical protein